MGKRKEALARESYSYNVRLAEAGPMMLSAMELLARYLSETHEEEMRTNHHGDGPSCTYCAAIAQAGRLAAYVGPARVAP